AGVASSKKARTRWRMGGLLDSCRTLPRRERLSQRRHPPAGIEELVGREAAQAALDVPARLIERNLLDEAVQRQRPARFQPRRYGRRPRIVGSERQRRMLEAREQLAQVRAADADVHLRLVQARRRVALD